MQFDANSASQSRHLSRGAGRFWAIDYLKRVYSQLSLRGKISIPFVSVLLGVWLLGTIAMGLYVSRSIERRTRQQNNAIAMLVLREFQQEKQNLRLDAKLIAESIPIRQAVERGDSSELLRVLIPLKSSLSINFLAVFDREGNILTDLKNQEIGDRNLASEAIRRQVLSGLSFTSLLESEHPAPSLLVGTAPISARQGTVGGLIVGNAIANEWLEQIAWGTGQHLAAFDNDGLIASTLRDEEGKEIHIRIPAGETARIRVRDRDYFARTATLPGLKDANFKLMVLSPLDSLKRAQQKLWLGIGTVSLGGSAIAIAVGYWVAGRIVRRIDNLARATRKLAKGDLGTRLPATSVDEIGQLAVDFNTMAAELVSREERLAQQMQQREEMLHQLKMTQAQLVQSEKMSSLGQMVAGIAHEINNPVNFIHGNLAHTAQYAQDLLALVNSYQTFYPHPTSEIQQYLEQIDFEFLARDFPKLLASMQIGTNRIREIVLGLRNFSRLDEAELKKVEIHTGIESTLLVIQHRLKARKDKPDIEIIKQYSCYPLQLKCYAGQLNQVFLNLLVNAIDALENVTLNPHITIRTGVEGECLKIEIADNGKGIPEEIQAKIFDPFFTTKPIGKGTGLGLAIVYQIIEQHGGSIECLSRVGKGTEFTIEVPLQ
ncbi:MAG: ATP-binding protein [Spirulina sp.]